MIRKMRIIIYLSKLTGIRPDLFLHFGCCFVPSIFGLYGAAFAIGLGIGKEYGDSQAVGNKWDWFDILADVLGCGAGLVVHYISFG